MPMDLTKEIEGKNLFHCQSDVKLFYTISSKYLTILIFHHNNLLRLIKYNIFASPCHNRDFSIVCVNPPMIPACYGILIIIYHL